MLFSSVPFLFYFLPAVLLVYFLVPKRAKNGVLLLSSLVFYGWGEPRCRSCSSPSCKAIFSDG